VVDLPAEPCCGGRAGLDVAEEELEGVVALVGNVQDRGIEAIRLLGAREDDACVVAGDESDGLLDVAELEDAGGVRPEARSEHPGFREVAIHGQLI
jgi:hypothetical protein